MITFGVMVNSSIVQGLTFSIEESRVDDVDVFISNINSLSSQLVHISMENEDTQNVIAGTIAEDFTSGVTISLFLRSDNTTEVSSDENTYMGIKAVCVELIP